MAYLLIFLFIRGPLVLRVFAWLIVLAIAFTAVMLPFLNPHDMPKGPSPHHAQPVHVRPASYVRR